MTYEQLLAEQPLSSAAGNLRAASRFVALLANALASKDLIPGLTVSQKNYLYKLKAKWEVRAAGDDESWNAYGSRPGRRRSTTIETRGNVDVTAFGDEHELDPLLRSLMRKYGTPRRTDDI